MYEFQAVEVVENRITKYVVSQAAHRLSFAEAIQFWIDDACFRSEFNEVIKSSPFQSLRIETPSLDVATAGQPFEFVFLNTPSFCHRRTDRQTFGKYFSEDEASHGVVAFDNLGGDATLIVPSPRVDADVYNHLASFVRGAPGRQSDALWQVVGLELQRKLSNQRVWLNTAGGGVSWLHVRIDDRPKYYGFAEYRSPRNARS